MMNLKWIHIHTTIIARDLSVTEAKRRVSECA